MPTPHTRFGTQAWAGRVLALCPFLFVLLTVACTQVEAPEPVILDVNALPKLILPINRAFTLADHIQSGQPYTTSYRLQFGQIEPWRNGDSLLYRPEPTTPVVADSGTYELCQSGRCGQGIIVLKRF